MSDENTVNTANTDLYNLRQRMAKNRESMQQSNNKYVEVVASIDNLKSTIDDLIARLDAMDGVQKACDERVTQIENKPVVNFSDVSQKISEWSSAELQPILDELCSDIENAITDVKIVKQQQQKQLAFNRVEDDALSSVDVRPSTAKPTIKSLQLQKKSRT